MGILVIFLKMIPKISEVYDFCRASFYFHGKYL